MPKHQGWDGGVYQFDIATDGLNSGVATHNRVWDSSSLQWVSMVQPGGGGSGGTVSQGAGGTSPWLTKSKLGIPAYDYASLSAGATADVWTFKSGGSGGTAVATVTINYTDSTKAVIASVART